MRLAGPPRHAWLVAGSRVCVFNYVSNRFLYVHIVCFAVRMFSKYVLNVHVMNRSEIIAKPLKTKTHWSPYEEGGKE